MSRISKRDVCTNCVPHVSVEKSISVSKKTNFHTSKSFVTLCGNMKASSSQNVQTHYSLPCDYRRTSKNFLGVVWRGEGG